MLLVQIDPTTKPVSIAEVTPRTKAIVAELEKPSDPVAEVPLEGLLRAIKRASKKGPNDPGIPVYVDPLGLQRADRSVSVMVPITAGPIPLRDRLERALKSIQMAYIVKDDVLIISDPRGIERERQEVPVRACDATPASRALLARLEEPLRMPFENETPLKALLAYIERATAGPRGDQGIKILVVPEGLKEAKRSLNSTLQIDLDGVPLRTTLPLSLDQLGLGCVVKDGRLVVHSRQGMEKLIRAAEGLEEPPRTRSGGNDAPAGRAALGRG